MSLTPHVVRVKTLYRQFLKNTFNWYGLDYSAYVIQANELREKFEKYRNVTDHGEIETLIKEAEALLEGLRHPDPYRPICGPGGGMFQRNVPFPRELLSPPPLHPNDYDYSKEKLL